MDKAIIEASQKGVKVVKGSFLVEFSYDDCFFDMLKNNIDNFLFMSYEEFLY